jgi:hypothetical protein
MPKSRKPRSNFNRAQKAEYQFHRKRLTNYTADDVGGVPDAVRLAQAAGVSCAV